MPRPIPIVPPVISTALSRRSINVPLPDPGGDGGVGQAGLQHRGLGGGGLLEGPPPAQRQVRLQQGQRRAGLLGDCLRQLQRPRANPVPRQHVVDPAATRASSNSATRPRPASSSAANGASSAFLVARSRIWTVAIPSAQRTTTRGPPAASGAAAAVGTSAVTAASPARR